MDVRELVIALAEKTALIATAALVVALAPPLRRRLLGVSMPRRPVLPVLLGMVLAMWGARSGLEWMDVSINVRAIGVFIAALLGGRIAGPIVGAFAGAFLWLRVAPDAGPVGFAESMLDGTIASLIVARAPAFLRSAPRAFLTTLAIQGVHVLLIAGVLLVLGETTYGAAWPAHVVKLLANAAGFALFVSVTGVVIGKEADAVALVEARMQADAAALEALRRRLEPHFLFNALNALRATIRTNPDAAREMVSDLADMYRYILTHPHEAALRDEIEHARTYLAIEQVRLGRDRLSIRTNVPPAALGITIPPLLLQPLVENAVRHGVASHGGAGVITIRATTDEENLTLDVENESEGARIERTRSGGSGVALKTLRQRLDKRYEGAASLELLPIERGMIARVKLPIRAPLISAYVERSAAA